MEAHAAASVGWVGRILVVGDVVDDIVVRPTDAVTLASDTTAEIRLHPGGSAANVAAWLGRLEVPVTFVGRAGAAGAARHRAALEAFGVDACIAADPDHVTATIVLLLDGAGERTMYVDRGANAALQSSDVPERVWDSAGPGGPVGWLHLTGYSFFDPAVRPTAATLFAAVRERGVGVSVDPSSAAFLRACDPDAFLRWVDGADVLLPNLDEGRVLSGRTEPDDVVEVLRGRFGAVVLTLGAEGAVGAAGTEVVRGTPVAGRVVDTTGAGDAYCAGFIAARTGGSDLAACMRRGARTAGEAVGRLGARPSSGG